MKKVEIPSEVLAAEIRAGHVHSGEGAISVIGDVAAALAAEGLHQAAAGPAGPKRLLFPPVCCNCLASGSRVRSIESASIVNRGVAYTFWFDIPHCLSCIDTANRRRPGVLGLIGSVLGIGVPLGIAIAVTALAYDIDALIAGSMGPGIAAALMWGWIKIVRRPRDGQASGYQAVYATGLEVQSSGAPTGFELVFANDGYADRFVTMNRDAGNLVRPM
jgi:hypothetical protein